MLQVETIGDAYMVVGGLPTPCDNHAERVLNMAFGMMEASIKVLSPADKMPLKVIQLSLAIIKNRLDFKRKWSGRSEYMKKHPPQLTL